jgi:hypothetical protein
MTTNSTMYSVSDPTSQIVSTLLFLLQGSLFIILSEGNNHQVAHWLAKKCFLINISCNWIDEPLVLA